MINWLSTGLSSMGLSSTPSKTNPDEIASLPSGQFHKLDKEHAKIQSRMLFPDSALEIRKSTQPNNYLLLVDRVFEDDESDDETSEQMFLIDASLCFSSSSGNPIEMSWSDPSEAGYSYTWTADSSVSKESITAFQRVCDI
jgi:hypothetical protein